MSLLQAFFMQFENKGLKEVSEEVKDADKKLDDFEETATKAEDETKKLGQQTHGTSQNFQQLGLQTARAIAPITAFGLAIRKTMDLAQQGEELAFLADKAGLTTNELNQMGIAAARFGGDFKGVVASIEKLREKGLTGAPEDIFAGIAQQMEGMNTQQKWEYGASLGLDEATIHLLTLGVEGYRKELERTKKYQVFTREDYERMMKFEQAMRDIKMGFTAIGQTIAQFVLPVITWFTEKFKVISEFLTEHKEFASFVVILLAIAGVLLSLKSIITGVSVALTGLAAIFGISTWWIAAIIAGIILLALVLEDLWMWVNGQDSLMGKLFGDFETVKKNFLNWIDGLKQKWLNFVATLKSAWQSLLDAWNNTPDWVKKLLTGNIAGATISGTVEGVKSIINRADKTPLNSMSTGTISTAFNNSSKTQNTNVGEIKIYTQATDAKGIAKDLNLNLMPLTSALRA